MSQYAPSVGIVSLGCAKALVDSERILTRLRAEGYGISPSYEGADVVIVNTCGFLDSARAESLDAIGEALAANGKVIVTGCMGVDETAIRQTHPNVLAVTGPHQYEAVIGAVHAAVPPVDDPHQSLVPPEGLRLTPRHYAYLKISEGCDHSCSFCIIPSLRGPLVSRPAQDIVDEASRLAQAGVKELLVISQDTGAYGQDLTRGGGQPPPILSLAEQLGDLGLWIRLHYVYPYPWVDRLIPMMTAGKLLPYLDVPFQHASPSVLRSMRRPADHDKLLDRIARWRDACPDLTLRSTFIVGFPGETERDFEFLLGWLERAKLDRVGCFKYENVAGAAANSLPGHVDEEVKEERFNRLTELARQVTNDKMQTKLGGSIQVLIDEVDEDGAIGRSMADSPEVDGEVYIEDATGLTPGDLITAKVFAAEDYDLWAERTPDATNR